MEKDEILKILEIVAKVYETAGKKISTAVLFDQGNEELVIDNRTETDIN